MYLKYQLKLNTENNWTGRNIRISNQFLITHVLHFAQQRFTTTPTVLSSKRKYHIGSQSII